MANDIYIDPHTAPRRWHDLAVLHEPYHYERLLEFAILFHDKPPYVALEIFDWLPDADRLSHRRKIALIVAVQRSIRKARGAACGAGGVFEE